MKGAVAIPLSPELKHFVEGLERLSKENFPVEKVTLFLKNNPLDFDKIEPYTFFSNDRYTRNLLYKTESFEVLFLCWMPHQASPIHGHEGEKCWMRVEKGILNFVDYSFQEGVEGVFVEPRHSAVGVVGFVDGPAVIHKVSNQADEPAISLHLYARPFVECDIFDYDAHKKARIHLDYFSVNGKLESNL